MTPLALLLLVRTVGAAEPPAGGWPTPPATGEIDPRAYHEGVYDGDTFTLSTGDKIRLKWVNTPEMRPEEPFAKEAREFSKTFVTGRPLTLVVDANNARDGYGRLVAGVVTPEGDLSEALLRAGLGHLFVIPPDSTDLQRLIAAQEEARAARRGIWSTDAYQGDLHITSFHANAPGDDTLNVNGEYMRVCNVSSKPVDTDGWRLVDIAGNTHRLPKVVVPAGHTIQVKSGLGATGADESGQLVVHLGSTTPLWNNEREVVELYDPAGRKVDFREHHGSSK